MNTANERRDANTSEPIRVYRNVFNVLALLFGFLFFLTVVLLDLIGVTAIGWFVNTPWLGYGFLLFLIMGICWLSPIVFALRNPVIEITQKKIRLASVSCPGSCITFDLSQISSVAASWQPDTVPTYVVFEMKSPEKADFTSVVWSRYEDSRGYYECSNLTMNAVEIARMLQTKIAHLQSIEAQC